MSLTNHEIALELVKLVQACMVSPTLAKLGEPVITSYILMSYKEILKGLPEKETEKINRPKADKVI